MSTEQANHGQIAIVNAGVADVELIAPLFDGYRQFYGQPSNPVAARDYLAERLSRDESVIFLALLDQNGSRQPAGFTQLYPLFSSVSLRRVWVLNDLFVAPFARGNGVARALLTRAQEYGIETNAVRLTLRTAVDNTPAQKVYEAMGWRRDQQFYTYTLAL